MSINRVNLSGNLGNDPELRATSNGNQILTFTVAVNDRKKDQSTGEWVDYPNWVSCVVFGNRAESLSRFLTRGMKVAIEGKLRYQQWQDKNGQRRSKLAVVVDEIEFMSQSKAQNQPQQQQPNNYANQYQNAANTGAQASQSGNYGQSADLYDEPIPF